MFHLLSSVLIPDISPSFSIIFLFFKAANKLRTLCFFWSSDNKDNLEQHLIVTYSIKYRNYQRSIRERQIERAKKFVDSPTKLVKNKANDPKRFVEQEHCTPDGEAANRTIASLNQKQIDNEAKYDGLYAVCTNLEYDVADMFHLLSSVLIPGISPSSQ